jgi:hypothetical protein
VIYAHDIDAGGRLSFWDALIVATARKGGASRILTEDLNAGQVVCGMRVVPVPLTAVPARVALVEPSPGKSFALHHQRVTSAAARYEKLDRGGLDGRSIDTS